jgi:hypothetical protein
MSWRLGERTAAGDEGRANRLGERDVHCVVGADVVAQLPRTAQKIEMGMAMHIEVREIRDRLLGPSRRHFTRPYETSKALSDLDVEEVGRVEFVLLTKEAGLDSSAERGLQQQLGDPKAFARKVRVLWLGVGTAEPERMRDGIRGFHKALTDAGIDHVYVESPGTDHEWQTWRRNLHDFAPRLFR